MKLGPLLKLVLRLTVFSAPLILGIGFLERGLRSMPTPSTEKHKILVERGPSAEIVIFGSSHADAGLDPAKFPCSAINLANDGQTLDIDLALMRELVRGPGRLQVLIVPVSLFSFHVSSGDFARLPEKVPRKLLGLDVPNVDWLSHWLGQSRVVKATPHTAIGFALRGFVPLPHEVTNLGWTPDPVKPGRTSIREASTKAEFHRMAMANDHQKEATLALLAILEIAKGVHAAPVLLVTPFHRNYLAAWAPSELAEFRARLSAIAYDYRVVVADYSQDPRFSDPDFADADHLSPGGAQRFSRILASEVIGPLVRCEGVAGGKWAP